MKAAELTGKTPDQLNDLALNLKKELFNLRFQKSTGELTNVSRFAQVRKDIARIYTAMNTPPSAKPAKAKKEKAAAPKKATKAKKSEE